MILNMPATNQTASAVDLVLQDKNGQPISLVEIKSYPKPSPSVRQAVIKQLKTQAGKLNNPKLRYITLLSTATGYIEDIKKGENIEFSTEKIIEKYTPRGGIPVLNSPILESVFSAWLRDLSFGSAPLATSEKKLEEFGFIDNIRGTVPVAEYRI